MWDERAQEDQAACAPSLPASRLKGRRAGRPLKGHYTTVRQKGIGVVLSVRWCGIMWCYAVWYGAVWTMTAVSKLKQNMVVF